MSSGSILKDTFLHDFSLMTKCSLFHPQWNGLCQQNVAHLGVYLELSFHNSQMQEYFYIYKTI